MVGLVPDLEVGGTAQEAAAAFLPDPVEELDKPWVLAIPVFDVAHPVETIDASWRGCGSGLDERDGLVVLAVGAEAEEKSRT